MGNANASGADMAPRPASKPPFNSWELAGQRRDAAAEHTPPGANPFAPKKPTASAPSTPGHHHPWSFPSMAERMCSERQNDSGMQELPPGWAMQFDSRQGRKFFLHTETGTATWIKPSAGFEQGRPPGVVIGVSLDRERLEVLTRLLMHHAVGLEVDGMVSLAKHGRNPFQGMLSQRALASGAAAADALVGAEGDDGQLGFVEAVVREVLSFSLYRNFHRDVQQLEAIIDNFFRFLPVLDTRVMPLRWDTIRQQSLVAVSSLLCHSSHAMAPAHDPPADPSTEGLGRILLKLCTLFTGGDDGEAVLRAFVAANTIDDMPGHLLECLSTVRTRFLAYLEHELGTTPQGKPKASKWIVFLGTVPHQTIVALARLRNVGGGSLIRSILEAMLTPNTLGERSVFQNMCATELGLDQVRRWIAEAMQTLPERLRSVLDQRLAECERIEELAVVVQEAPQLLLEAQRGGSLMDQLWCRREDPAQQGGAPPPGPPGLPPISPPPTVMKGGGPSRHGTTAADPGLLPMETDQPPSPANDAGSVSSTPRVKLTPDQTADLETVFLIINLEGYRRGAEQLVDAYGEVVFTSLVKELYSTLLDPFVELFRHPSVDIAGFLEVLFSACHNILGTSMTPGLDQASKTRAWAAQLHRVEEVLFALVRQAISHDFALWAEMMKWAAVRLEASKALRLDEAAAHAVNELSADTRAQLWREIDALLPQCSQRRPLYQPGSLSSTQLESGTLPCVRALLKSFRRHAYARISAARRRCCRYVTAAAAPTLAAFGGTFGAGAGLLQPMAQPALSPSVSMSDDEVPLQHIKVVVHDPVESAMLETSGFVRVDGADTRAAPAFGRSMGGNLSIWVKRGPTDQPVEAWAVAPLTSLVLVADQASARAAQQAGVTVLAPDLNPAFHSLGLAGKLQLGYRRGEPDQVPIRRVELLSAQDDRQPQGPREFALFCQSSMFRSAIRIVVTRCAGADAAPFSSSHTPSSDI